MSWDDEAATWDDNLAVRAYAEAAFQALKLHLAVERAPLLGARVLDFGCGTGLLTVAMAAEADDVVGLDLSPAMIEVLRHKAVPNITFGAGRLDDYDLGRFDLITCASVFPYVPDYPGTVRALAALLNPGGWLVQFDWEPEPAPAKPFGMLRLDVRRALVDAGLLEVDVRTAFELTFRGRAMAPLLGVGRAPR